MTRLFRTILGVLATRELALTMLGVPDPSRQVVPEPTRHDP